MERAPPKKWSIPLSTGKGDGLTWKGKGKPQEFELERLYYLSEARNETITRGIKKENQLPKRWMTGV